jgi:hypothetical protein
MITLATEFRSLKSIADRGMSITLVTNELTPEQAKELYSLLHAFCFTAFKKDDFKKNELEFLDHLETELDFKEKPKSQRLKAVLFRLWEQKPEGYEDFELFYRFKMERIIDKIKNLLE